MATLITDRILLLKALRAAGPTLIVAISAVLLITSLVPTATAVAVAYLVNSVEFASASALILLPLLAFAVMTGIGHLMDAAKEPLFYLARVRIDGAHRWSLTRLTGSGPGIGTLESPQVQGLVREARADPDNWTQRTPADGALAQLDAVTAVFGMAAACLVLARYAWWLIPIIVVPAFLYRSLERRRNLEWYLQWQRGMHEGLRSEKWEPAIVSSGEGKETRVFGLADWVVQRMQHHTRAMFEPVWALGGRQLRQQWIQLPVIVLPLTLAYVLVSDGAADGRVTAAVATAVLTSAWAVFQVFIYNDVRDPVGAIACLRATAELHKALADGEPSAPTAPDPAAPAPAELPPVTAAAGAPRIRFDEVSFTYPRTERLVLDRLSLDVRPGELVGIVGLNGVGKSTLIKLLAGLYRPTGGRVSIDGADLRQLNVTAWRRRLAIVYQDFIRYHLSIADNITLGYPGEIDRAALEAAARDSGLEPVLAELPLGWDTPLSRDRTNGVELSGGQWQQVVLARALYAVRMGARVLVLDEPTAHLDVRTEFDVFQRLIAHKGDATVVLISHRLSTVRQADRIALIEHGRVTESGSHDELMALGGAYEQLFAIQAQRFSQGYDDRIEEGELL